MNGQALSSLDLEKKQSSITSQIKLLVFSIGKLSLALPVEQVQKVTKYTPIYGSGRSYVNLTLIGEQEITIVDLYQKLFNISYDELNIDGGYFILTKPRPISLIKEGKKVTHDSIKETLGIRAIEAPHLIDISLSEIRTLPNSYRYSDTLEIASHVAIITQEDKTTQTIFILDLEHLI
jgi:chemotaxis signal transduction protein